MGRERWSPGTLGPPSPSTACLGVGRVPQPGWTVPGPGLRVTKRPERIQTELGHRWGPGAPFHRGPCLTAPGARGAVKRLRGGSWPQQTLPAPIGGPRGSHGESRDIGENPEPNACPFPVGNVLIQQKGAGDISTSEVHLYQCTQRGSQTGGARSPDATQKLLCSGHHRDMVGCLPWLECAS